MPIFLHNLQGVIPNIDDHSTTPQDIVRLGKEMCEASAVFARLASYSAMKAKAMQLRMDGKINEAVRLEEALEITYQSLPDWARW